MCRHLAYLGPALPLASLVLDPPHSLLHQSWAPTDMRGGGTINADGFGVGWYTDTGTARYRRAAPLWSATDFTTLARHTTAPAVLAAVRSATDGMAGGDAACAPFADGDWLFSHNGVVAGWPDSVGKLAERLPVRDLLTLDATTDSALLWALVRDRLRAGATPAAALASVIADVTAAAPGSRVNLLLTDGHRIVATTWGHSLWTRATADALLVCSEPLDADPAWQPVPDRRLLEATRSSITWSEL